MKVQRAERLMRVNKRTILGCFSLYFIKTCHDTPLKASHSKCIMTSYVIIKTHDITSFYDVVISLTMHMWQVMWPIGIKGGLHMVQGLTQVLPPKTFKQLDHSKHTQVATCLVHPHDWSLLPSTVFDALSWVFATRVHSITCTQVFQRSHLLIN